MRGRGFDLIEANEAVSGQVLAVNTEFGSDPSKVLVNDGGLDHPIEASGVRG